MIKALIFDCFGVLTKDTWKEFVATVPENIREEARSYNRAYDRGDISKPEFLAAVEDLTGKQPEYVDDLLDNEIEKNTALLDYIKSLKNTYKTGILSNVATNWIRDYLLNTEENKLFDVYIFSYEVGMTKPDPKIYLLAAERLGVKPSECVFIDDIDRYCEAAREVGMKAFVYTDLERLKDDLNSLLLADSED